LVAALGPSSPHFGLVCVVLLGLSSVARALLNAHFSYKLVGWGWGVGVGAGVGVGSGGWDDDPNSGDRLGAGIV
jgi:hypothetical protein